MNRSVTVLGAGIVGVSCALELQRQGADVTLIDRSEPGTEASYGNTGIISRSSFIPNNNPQIWKSLPRYILNQSPQFRYDMGYAIRNWLWICSYLAHARQKPFSTSTTALNSLVALSSQAHLQWIAEAKIQNHLHQNGSLYLYRSNRLFNAQAWIRRIYDQHRIKYEVLDSVDLNLIEPSLKSIFERAIWVKDDLNVDNPRTVVQAYFQLFTSRGGHFVRKDVRHISRGASPDNWILQDAAGSETKISCLVIALGSWAVDILLPLGIRIPMVHERGYHMNYSAQNNAILNRPVYDIAGGYTLTPTGKGLRLCTGVELTDLGFPPSTEQLDMAYTAAKQAFPLGLRMNRLPWQGHRPTLPDYRPMIGAVPDQNQLWLAIGHQHIGFCTAPGSAMLLACLINNAPPPIDPAPFSPKRYL